MTGFTSIASYSPWLVLLAGGFTIAGIVGVGDEIGRALRLSQPWRSVIGSIAAIELLTLTVEAVAMAHFASRPVLIGIWVVFSVLGSLLFIWRTSLPKSMSIGGIGGLGAAAILVVNLTIALCPSTKGDEIYYHMIVPSRIVQDGGLQFYRQPLRSAIYPQMAFQIGQAPFHALGVPDAGNLVSWFFGALLVWFTYRIVLAYTGSRRWAGIFAAAIVAGLYTSVWHVASGAHAIGDVAVTAAVVALYTIDDFVARIGRPRAAISIGILAAAAASTKVLLFPLVAAVVLVALVRLGPKSAPLLLLPSILFMVPLMVWTAVHAGSPLGPLMEGIAGRSPYLPNEVRGFVDDYVAGLRGPIREKLRNEALNYSPIIALAIAAFALAGRRVRAQPAMGIALLLVQLVVILGWNTYDVRYFGGVHYALMIVFAIFLAAELRDRALADRRFMVAAALLVVPWMLLQLVYATQFLKLIAGVQSKSDFYTGHVPFFRDFVLLDDILPRDAVLLAFPYGLDSIYAP
ncbi:MAG TPA: hypothetical protein VKL19_13050, partial [Thermoanaerobaculia bacterium]|nr:hypothetical protein [Thermoanaerobaculia bacterium]